MLAVWTKILHHFSTPIKSFFQLTFSSLRQYALRLSFRCRGTGRLWFKTIMLPLATFTTLTLTFFINLDIYRSRVLLWWPSWTVQQIFYGIKETCQNISTTSLSLNNRVKRNVHVIKKLFLPISQLQTRYRSLLW